MPVMNTDFHKALNGQVSDTIPIWMMRQAGRYLPEYRAVRKQAGDFLNLCYTPKLASEVTLQPLRRYDFSAAIIFSDILVVPHALGQHVWFEEGEGPRLDPIQSVTDLPAWDKDQFLKHLESVFEALDITRTALAQDKSLIGFAGAPWTLACYMINGRGSRDYQNVRVYARQNQQAFQALLDLLVQAITVYLIQKVKSGADIVQIFDSWAGVLSADEFERYCIAPTRKIIEGVRKVCPDTPIIGFPRGAGFNYPAYIAGTGINAVSCDQSIPLDQMKNLQDKICVQGNLDNVLLQTGGADMMAQVEKICTTLAHRPFIFNLGHGVIKDTNPDHVAQIVDFVRNFNRFPD